MMTVTAETSMRRGRHRRPRPRKLLFAVSGLALAAGALSLVRMAPDSGSAGLGTTEADPGQDPAAGTDQASTAVAAVAAAPRVSPSATYAMGGATTTPTAPSTLVPMQTAPPSPSLAPTPGSTTIPVTPNTPAATATQQPPATEAPAPRSSPTPGRTTSPPTPQPSETEPGLCVPAIGLCVDSLARR
ncbi:hypothetical protein GCM10010276_65440 [Streptomyces longisporus]|uniref:Uncharacterized protein n=1 Tax=Streptomyces longisporus TaxID=1948 RepID=A0ABP6A3U6_STRLO